MTRHEKRIQRLVTAAMVVLVAGCGGESGGGSVVEDAGPPQDGGTAILAEGSDISTPIALLASTELDGNLSGDVMNMALLRGAWEDGRLVFHTAGESPMALARSYEYQGADSSIIVFHMRSDVKWSDGEPLTSRDVVYTYSILEDPDLASPMQNYGERIDSVVAQNDSTVTFYFQRRYPKMISDASITPLPEHVFGDTPPGQIRNSPAILDPANHLVVSGPFMIGEWVKGQRVTLVRNPYFAPKAHLDRLVFRIIPEATTRLVELQTGGIDFLHGISTDRIQTLEGQSDIRFERESKRNYDYIGYSQKGYAPFRDKDIRRALSLAIDLDRLVAGLGLEGYAQPAGGPYPPIFALYDPSMMSPIEYDPDEARRILASKGWSDTDGDGILDRNGQPFHFTLVTNSGNPRRADASLIIQQQWKEIGVDVELRQLEFNTLISNLLKQDYQAVMSGWVAGLNPDYITNLYRSDGPNNLTGYSNPQVDSILDAARAQPTSEAARPLWQEAAVRIAADQPYTWLYYLDAVDAIRSRLRGVTINAYGPYQNTWEWWIPKDQQRDPAAR